MAVTNKTFLDLAGLTTYDGLIKGYIDTADALSIKFAKVSEDGNNLLLYKDKNASASSSEASADYTIPMGSTSLKNFVKSLGTAVGATLNQAETAYSVTFTGDLASYTNAVAAIQGLDSKVGTLASLSTTDKTSIVAAINEVLGAITTAIEGLDVSEFALASKSAGDIITIKGIKEVDGKIAVGTSSANDITFAKVAATGVGEDVSYDGTTSGIQASDVQGAIDEIKGGLGTAAAADVATTAIVESSTDDNLVSAAQVATFVAAEIAGLEGAMHFRGVITRQTGETDAQAIARVITDPEAGDVVVMSDNAKEYIYDGTAWSEVGDETEFVKKTTTIAGVDLQDNITKTELLTALNVEDGAEVNIIETVKVDGSALTPDANRAVDIDLATPIATAIGALDTANDVAIATYAAGTSGAADVITLTGAINEVDGIVGGVSTDNITLSTITSAQINNLFSAS